MRQNAGLSPCGESGLKLGSETLVNQRFAGLSPCGESGLKYLLPGCRRGGLMSLPVWGEWIEIGSMRSYAADRRSLPVWGEWIEIFLRFFGPSGPLCLSPCGESGLKSLHEENDRFPVNGLSPCGESGLK